jgi:hydrogenase-4 component F
MQPTPTFLAVCLLVLPLAAAVLVWLPHVLLEVGASREHAQSPYNVDTIKYRLQEYVTIVTSLASVVAVFGLAHTMTKGEPFKVLFIDMYLDPLSIYFLLLVTVVAVVASFYAGPSWQRLEASRGPKADLHRTLFFCFFNLFHFTMVLVPMVSNLVVLWIGIELTTVTSTALVAAERTRWHFEAAWKYIVITSTGIIFALLGTLFLASAIPKTSPDRSMRWIDLLDTARELNPDVVKLSFLFILIGYGAKAGLAPMHTWLPDAHGEAPYPVSALLSGVLLKSGFYVILRFLTITNANLQGKGFTTAVLLCVGLLSVVAATPLILKRNRFKRVLAYHSLEHMGIITVGVGIGGPIAMFGALLHVLNHGVTKSLLFLAYGTVQNNFPALPPRSTDRRAPVVEYRGVLRALPWTGALLALGGLALVGSPPFSIFLSEFLILWGGVKAILVGRSVWLLLAIVVLLLSVTFIFGGLVRHLGVLLLGRPPKGVQTETGRQYMPLLALFFLVILLGVVIPDLPLMNLRRLLEQSVAVVCNGVCLG